MNPFDVAVIGVVVVSALFAFVRGFLKEALSIIVWIGAAAAAYYAYPFVLPFAKRMTSEAWLAQAGTAIGTFVVALIVLALLGSTISTSVRGTALGPVDRLLGLLYGLARGAVIVCLLYIGVTALIAEPDRPIWFSDAQSLPTLARGATMLETILPSRAKSLATDTVDAGKRAADPAGTVLGTRPILPPATGVQLPAPGPAQAPASTVESRPTPLGPTSAPTSPTATTPAGISESERLMRPPAPAAPAAPEKPNYRNDDRKAMDRAFQSVQ